MRFGDRIGRIETILPDLPTRAIAVEELTSNGLVIWVGSMPLHSGDTKYLELHYLPDGTVEIHTKDATVKVVQHGDDW